VPWNSSIGSRLISPATALTTRSPFSVAPAVRIAFAATRNAAIGPLSLTTPSPKISSPSTQAV
jgi:hypothetical protein